MKKLLILFCVCNLMFIYSCKDDEDTELTKGIEGTHLKIDDIKAYLPIEFETGKKAVYTDANKNETTLSISYEEYTATAQYGGQSYLSDKVEISLYMAENPNFLIALLPGANYAVGNSIVRAISVVMMPGNQSGSIIGSIKFDENGNPIHGMLDDFRETLNLQDKTFKDCFVLKNNAALAYSEIYINSDVGVVAFRDEVNKRWVFDRFE
ncbi:MAG: hypothetical protein ACE5FF_01445 [Saprospiraceae bacterium]